MPQPDEKTLGELVLRFCHFPLQAQMVTFDRHGMPVGRTLAADLKPDYTVDMLTFPFFGRVKHLRRDPRMMLIWVEGKRAGAIYPRAVFARGRAGILQGEPAVALYAAKVAAGGHLPHLVRPDMTFEEPRLLEPPEIRERMCVVHFTAEEVRAEGFSDADDPLDPRELLHAVTWRPQRP